MANRGLADEPALYLYGISQAPASGSDGDRVERRVVEGMDGVHPVRALPCGPFVCWVSDVDHYAFAQEMEHNRENLEWLALHGVRHQRAVAEIAAGGTVIPARFGAIFSGRQALVKDVQKRKAALQKVFARISNADEWGVKVFAAPEAAPASGDAHGGEARSGREYLQRKAARLKKPSVDHAGLQEFMVELEKIALDSASSGKVSGGQPGLIWQATFLVPRSRRKKWDQILRTFAQSGGALRIEINGPWPPYSFVSDADVFDAE